jgi:hypothetical protein
MISINDLLTTVTTDQQEEKFLVSLEAVGLKPRAWRKGGALRTILRVIAGAFAGFSTSMLGFVQAAFIETSTAGWLTLLAFYVYGVSRITATFASGNVQLTNTGGGVYPVVAGGLIVNHATTGKAYTNVSAFTLNPGDTNISIAVTAVEFGTPSNAAAGTVTVLQTQLAGVTCTNSTAIVGSDDEKDPDLRQRCRDKLSTLSGKGPRGAYAYAVKSALRPDGSPVDVNRLSISPSSSTGVVTIYVASSSGAPLSTDLPYITTSIETYARPDSVTATLLAANSVLVTRTLTVWATRTVGVLASDIQTMVQNALIAFFKTYPIGGTNKPPAVQGYLWATAIEGVAKSAHPSIFAIDGANADVLMNVADVATNGITVSVTIVDLAASSA